MLHSAFERAVKERLILRNPTEDCIAPKVQKIEMQILSPEHIKDYLEAADRRGLLPMFYLELVTGLRKGEITALLWSDLDAKEQNHLRQQAICQKSQWRTDAVPSQNGDFGQKSIYPAGCRRPADSGTRQASRESLHVPLAGNW